MNETAEPPEPLPEPADETADPHLRSASEIGGYGICACDGELGKVEDFVVDDETWMIRYLVIDTQNWWPGKKILLPPQWITGVSWTDHTVLTDLNIATVRGAPEWNPNYGLTRTFEEKLHAYYGRKGYWVSQGGDKRDC